MTKPRVLVDVDGVLVDFITPALEIVSEIYGQKVIEADLKTWDLFDHVGKLYEDACYTEWCKPGWCRNLKPYPGAREGLQELQEIAEVYIVTSPITRSPTWAHERMEALRENFGIDAKKIVSTSAKYLCVGHALVEDHPTNITRWLNHHPVGLGLLIDRPYNRAQEVGVRVKGLSAAAQYLKAIWRHGK